jgi:di/tricarboxylate transporter
MTTAIGLLFAILGAAMILFSTEWVPIDVTALGVLLSLIITGLLPADRAFAGFGSETLILLLSLFILTAALLRTGVVERVGHAILRYAGVNATRLLATITVASAALGAFISNTASTAFFVPIVMRLARRTRISVAKLLMPMAFASILTSSVTLVSTSTNVVVSGLMVQYGLSPMGMFELAPVGVPIMLTGLLYLLTLGRRLLPDRPTVDDEEDLGNRLYVTEMLVLPESSLIGTTLAESKFGQELNLTLLRVARGKRRYLVPRADLELESGDVLLAEGPTDEILKIKDAAGVSIKADVKLSAPGLQSANLQLVEAVLVPPSPLIGRTLKSFRFRDRCGLQVLAINRRGGTMHRKLSQVRLKMGDILLLQGSRADLAAGEKRNLFSIIGTLDNARPKLDHAPLAIAIFVSALAAATFGVLSLPVAMLLGVLVAFVTGCINPDEAYRQVEWKVLILVGSMLAVGAAMEYTGAARFVAAQLVNLLGHVAPVWLLTAFFGLAVLLTQPMSNQAAAIVLVPVAMQTARQSGLNPRTFAMMIAVAASCSYLTPLEPSCLMVYGPGQYKFMDFVRVGWLLTLLTYVIAIVLVPLIWPL